MKRRTALGLIGAAPLMSVSPAGNDARAALNVNLKLDPNGSRTAVLKLPTSRRGQFKPAGITVFTRYPTGLFHAWGWLRFDLPLLVERPGAVLDHHELYRTLDPIPNLLDESREVLVHEYDVVLGMVDGVQDLLR